MSLANAYATVPVAADGLFALDTQGRRPHLMVEADRGSMQIKRFLLKLKAYAAYRESEKLKSKYKIEKFGVLTVTSSAARCRNLLAAAAEEEDVRERAGMFLFTTEDQLSLSSPETIFEKIWTRPGAREPCSILDDGAVQKSNNKGESNSMSSTRPNEARHG